MGFELGSWDLVVETNRDAEKERDGTAKTTSIRAKMNTEYGLAFLDQRVVQTKQQTPDRKSVE